MKIFPQFREVPHPLEVVVGLTPKNLPLGLTCYRAKFVGSAAMLPIAESSTENSAAWGPFPGELEHKFNHF